MRDPSIESVSHSYKLWGRETLHYLGMPVWRCMTSACCWGSLPPQAFYTSYITSWGVCSIR